MSDVEPEQIAREVLAELDETGGLASPETYALAREVLRQAARLTHSAATLADHEQTPSGVTILAHMPDGSTVNLTEGVMAMYDLVIGGMDWGSGFWTVEDALPVVKVAETCGFDRAEEAHQYVQAQRFSEEQGAFLKARQAAIGTRAYKAYRQPGDEQHEHVLSSTGRCMWPDCKKGRP